MNYDKKDINRKLNDTEFLKQWDRLKRKELLKEFGKRVAWVPNNIILLGRAGSVARGLNTEGSDEDFSALCIPPINLLDILKDFELGRPITNENNSILTSDDDYMIMSLHRHLNLAMIGKPIELELFFLKKEHYLITTSWSNKLIANRDLLLSKQIYSHFKKENAPLRQAIEFGNKNTKHKEHYSYPGKRMSEYVRQIENNISILEHNDFCTYSQNAELLLEIKKGNVPLDVLLSLIEEYEEKLEKAFEKSIIPEKPDEKRINDLIANIQKEFHKSKN